MPAFFPNRKERPVPSIAAGKVISENGVGVADQHRSVETRAEQS